MEKMQSENAKYSLGLTDEDVIRYIREHESSPEGQPDVEEQPPEENPQKPEPPKRPTSKPTNLKDFLFKRLGYFGSLLADGICILLTIAPLVFLGLPLWLNILLIAVGLFGGRFGSLVMAPFWIWAFVVVVRGPLDMWAIAFYIGFFAFFAGFLVPVLFALFVLIGKLFVRKKG